MPCIFYHNTETIDRCVTSVILLRCDVLPANPGSLIHFFDTSETPCCRPSTHPDSSSREMVSTYSWRNTAKSPSLQTPESSIHRLPSNKIESCGSSRVSVDRKLCCYLLDSSRRPTSLPGSEQFSQCTFPLLGDYFVANFSKTISTERKAQKARVEGSFGLYELIISESFGQSFPTNVALIFSAGAKCVFYLKAGVV